MHSRIHILVESLLPTRSTGRVLIYLLCPFIADYPEHSWASQGFATQVTSSTEASSATSVVQASNSPEHPTPKEIGQSHIDSREVASLFIQWAEEIEVKPYSLFATEDGLIEQPNFFDIPGFREYAEAQSDIRDAEEAELFVLDVPEKYKETEETGAYLCYSNVLWQSRGVVS